jgi:hypothetical protein
MTRSEIKAKSADNYVNEVVPVSLSDLIDNDLEGFLDIVSELLLGEQGVLSDISYDVVGSGMSDDIHIRVEGYAELFDEMADIE